MAVAAWLVWREGGWKERSWNLRLFVLQWLLNVLWTPLFFGMHLSGLAFAEIVVLWFAVAATMVLFWKVRKAAGVLLATLSGVGELRRHAKLHHLADEPMRHRYA
jgi:tryptophan-rich sensory protein